MSPRKVVTKPADRAWATGRRRVAEKYLEVAQLIEVEDGAAVNVCVSLSVLTGIAAGDAICASATGRRYSGHDHAAAADLLHTVDKASGDRLRALVALKPAAQYGAGLLTSRDRLAALRSASALVVEATQRTRTG